MVVSTGNFDRGRVTSSVLLKKWIQHFEHESFHTVCGLGQFRVRSQCPVQIDLLIDYVVGPVQLSIRTWNAKGKKRKISGAIFQYDMAFQIGKDSLRSDLVRHILGMIFFSQGTLAESVHPLLSVSLGKFPIIDSKIAL